MSQENVEVVEDDSNASCAQCPCFSAWAPHPPKGDVRDAEGLQAGRKARRLRAVESWHEEVDGHAIEFVTFKQDIDSTPMLKGLPNDQCHCPTGGTCSREE